MEFARVVRPLGQPPLLGAVRLIAPDLPSLGLTEVPGEQEYRYDFASLSRTIASFVDVLGLSRYILYLFDYGAPVGLDLALSEPYRIAGIVPQNGNAYLDGLGEKAWAPLRAYWTHPSDGPREAIRAHEPRWRAGRLFSKRCRACPDRARSLHRGRRDPGPTRQCGPAGRSQARLQEESRALPALSGLPPGTSPKAVGRVGPQRPVLHSSRRRSLQARPARGASRVARLVTSRWRRTANRSPGKSASFSSRESKPTYTAAEAGRSLGGQHLPWCLVHRQHLQERTQRAGDVGLRATDHHRVSLALLPRQWQRGDGVARTPLLKQRRG